MAQDTTIQKVVLSDDPQRTRLRELQARIDARRDAIAEMDLEIETLREQLASFEIYYHAQLHDAHAALKRVEGLIDHLERWGDVLRARLSVAVRGTQLDDRRAKEVKLRPSPAHPAEESKTGRDKHVAEDKPAAFAPPTDKAAELKDVYRALARRFHPDLARDEETRVRHSQLMARINTLYRSGDLQGLIAVREKARGSEVNDPNLDVDEQITLLEKRLKWFDTVFANLQDDRGALEQSATCELWRDAQQAKEAGRDLFAELREESAGRLARAYTDVPEAIHDLENAVSRYNRQQTARGLQKRKAQAVEQVFDPYVDKSLVRLALDDLNIRNVSATVRRAAADIEALAAGRLDVLRLVLFTAVSELSPYPLSGLESFDDLQSRYDTLAVDDGKGALPLQEALVLADSWLEFGVRHASEKLAHAGLRFRADDVRKAVPLALRTLAVRRQFKRVLSVLGERRACSACHEEMFAVPLYRLRGLDDLRALVCPLCGETLSKYWMPRGKDVQAVLNAAFVDYEIVSEWSFALSRASIATQLTPVQLETMTIGALKRMVMADVFERNELCIKPAQVALVQQGKVVSERTKLLGLDKTRFRLQFRATASMSENDALEIVRHRIRNRFKA